MRWHKKSYWATVQTNVEPITENFKNIGAVVSSKLIELRKSPTPTIVKEISKLEAFKDIKQLLLNVK